MKPSIVLFFGALSCVNVTWAQSATTSYRTDVNGTRVPNGAYTTNKDGEKTEVFQSVNGRQIPLEQVVEKVLREDANGKVVERTVRKYDPTGQLSTTEREVREETKLPGGGSTVRSTTYVNDINGNSAATERKTVETRVQGSTTTAETVIDRPTFNGSFATAEKRSALTEGTEANRSTTESVYRTDVNGALREATRSVKTVVKNGDQITETTADYQPVVSNKLELYAQSQTVTKKLPDGSEVSEVNLYSNTVPGRVFDNAAPMKVKEQQIIERHTLPDGSVTETLSVRRPSIADPARLGDLQKLSETVCTGKCAPEPAPAAAPPAATPTAPKPVAGNSRP